MLHILNVLNILNKLLVVDYNLLYSILYFVLIQYCVHRLKVKSIESFKQLAYCVLPSRALVSTYADTDIEIVFKTYDYFANKKVVPTNI